MLELIEAIKYKLVQNKDTVVVSAQIPSPGLKLSDYIGSAKPYRIYPAYDDVRKSPTYPCMVVEAMIRPEESIEEQMIALVRAYLLTTSSAAMMSGISLPKTQLNNFFKLVDYWLSEYDGTENDMDSVQTGGNLIIGDKYSVASFKLDFYDLNGYDEQLGEYQASVRWMANLIRQ